MYKNAWKENVRFYTSSSSHRLKPGKIESSQIRCSMCMNFKIGQGPHVSLSHVYLEFVKIFEIGGFDK